MGIIGTIIFWIVCTIVILFTIGYLIAAIVIYKADKESKKQKIALKLYKAKAKKDLADRKDLPYQVYVLKNGKLFYEDQQNICLIQGLNDYYEVHPERKGQRDIFIDPDPQVCNIIFVGPFNKF